MLLLQCTEWIIYKELEFTSHSSGGWEVLTSKSQPVGKVSFLLVLNHTRLLPIKLFHSGIFMT